MACHSILRVAISQCTLFALLCYVFVTLGYTLTTENVVYYRIERNTYYVTAGFFMVPFLFSTILLLGVLKENLLLVRIWILASMFNTIILMCLLFTASIRASRYIPVPWAVLLNILPILLVSWMLDNTVVVIECSKQQECSTKQKEAKKNILSSISIA